MNRIKALLVVFFLLFSTPAFAARVYPLGFETCDKKEYTEGGTTATSVSSTNPRTGRCALVISATSGSSGYASVSLTAANEAYHRFYGRLDGLPTDGRVSAGFYGSSSYGCREDVEPDGTVSLRFKDRTTYLPVGQSAPMQLTCSTDADCNGGDCIGGACYHAREIHEKLLSGTPPCASNCQVQCELTLNGTKIATGIVDISSGDYQQVSSFRFGDTSASDGTYTQRIDDVVGDTTTPIGLGYVAPKCLNASPSGAAWGNIGSAGDCGSGTARWGCVNDWCEANGDDADSTGMEDSSNGDQLSLDVSDITLGANESIKSVQVFALAKHTTSGTRTYQLDLTDSGGTNVITGTSHSTTLDTYLLGARKLSETKPGGGSWTQTDFNSMKVRFNKTSAGNNRLTAVLVEVDVLEPDPPFVQNLQDWAKLCGGGSNAGNSCSSNADCPSGVCYQDGVFTVAMLGDSMTQGPGQGNCAGDASVSCTVTTDCQPPITGADVSPCLGSGKYPTVVSGRIVQKVGSRASVVMNCGIDGNDTQDVADRLGPILTGSGQAGRRYCKSQMPTQCTASGGCTSIYCFSNDCTTEPTGAPQCMLGCTVVAGNKVCSGNHRVDCSVDGDCSGSKCIGGSNQDASCSADSTCTGGGKCVAGGTCTDLPGADYVVLLIGINDIHETADYQCGFRNSAGPCPPVATTTPNATPTPGLYHIQRVACQNDSECWGGSAGLCSNDFQRACDSNTDCNAHCRGGSNPGAACTVASECPGGGSCTSNGTCDTTKKLPNYSVCAGSCSNDLTRNCASDISCLEGGTCSSTYKFCSPSCARVPCNTSQDCGPATTVSSNGRIMRTDRYGDCVNGYCSNCGWSGCPGINRQYDEDQGVRGLAQYGQGHLTTLANYMVLNGRRLVHLTPTPMYEPCTLFGWGGSRDAMRRLRKWILDQNTTPNVIDMFKHWRARDDMRFPRRCNNNASKLCTTNADCGSGSGAACLTFYSTLRSQFSASFADEVHPNSLGANVDGDVVADYLLALQPRCSLDPSTSCGKCSVTTATSCVKSSDCPSGEKCWANDAVCSGASKGTCIAERAGNRCTEDLGTSCSTNADCTAINAGVCAPEGFTNNETN